MSKHGNNQQQGKSGVVVVGTPNDNASVLANTLGGAAPAVVTPAPAVAPTPEAVKAAPATENKAATQESAPKGGDTVSAQAPPAPTILIPERFVNDQLIVSINKFFPEGPDKKMGLENRIKQLEFEEKQGEAMRLPNFEAELKDPEKSPLFKAILDAAKRHSITEETLAGRRFVLTFPSGKYTFLSAPAVEKLESAGGKKKGAGGGRGFRGTPVEMAGVAYTSLNNFCEINGIQYNGMRNALDAVEQTLQRGTRAELPYQFKVFDQENKPVHYNESIRQIVSEDGKPPTKFNIRKTERVKTA